MAEERDERTDGRTAMIAAFEERYGDISQYADHQHADRDWYLVQMGTWKMAWDAAMKHAQAQHDVGVAPPPAEG